jgi:hypothetical protein
LAASCFGGAERPERPARPAERAPAEPRSATAAAAAGIVAANHPGRSNPFRTIAELKEDEPGLVVLVVMDTLRADQTSFCGAADPNTPVLDQMKELGAVWSCDARSPATWTLPSHASYFTGATTSEHGVHTHGTALGQNYETLAETFSARGYQTLLISGNPVFVNKAGGFWQGFDRVVSAKALSGPLRGLNFSKIVDEELARLDKSKPLFLVVNIFDAHDPYPAVPEGIPWAKPQERTNLLPHTADPTNPYFRFVTGTMAAEERPDYLANIHNAYKFAVHVADDNLGKLFRGLRQDGWLKQRRRIVVTSDHGEHLGEHQLLRHGSAAWETVTSVPFLYYGSEGTVTELPRPMNVTNAYWLLRDGKLPDAPLLVESASMTNPDDFKPSFFTVALWNSPSDKLMHYDGKDWRFDLAADPGELSPIDLKPDWPGADLLAKRVTEQRASFEAAMARAPDEGVMEMLRAVGYVQDKAAPADVPPHAPAPDAPPATP